MKRYNPKLIEKRWQKYWQDKKLYKTADKVKGKQNFMKLVEFPYPSGDLHIGHWYSFSVPDIYARYKRMTGYNVMYPIGFDAFGLPAENAAIKRGLQPKDWTEKNIKNMTKQFKSMGSSIDWSRVVSTIDPEYYKWTQWIFLQFYKNGLAYRAKTLVNWCPKDKTVLANEQVMDGKCDRCGSQVEQKEREQWMYKITDYAEKLLEGLDRVDWPEVTKTAQRNWIGKKEGALVKFPMTNDQYPVKELEIFTTRPDTIFGATFLVASPELAKSWINKGWEAPQNVKDYVSESFKKTEQDRITNAKDKTGVDSSLVATNPANKEQIPIWIADYVVGSYGTGAIMAVPAHDERDFEFAKKYELPIRQVIENMNGPTALPFTEKGRVINSEKFSWANGLLSEDAAREIVEELGYHGIAEEKITYRLRDWILSRQRYWGTPIPLIFCEACKKRAESTNDPAFAKASAGKQIPMTNPGWIPVPEKELPVELPKLKDYLPADDGRSPLAKAEKWVKVKCPECGGPAERETDTMDTFVDSSWYFIRYPSTRSARSGQVPWDPELTKLWLPVPLYTGGAEHNTMHLLYSRFFYKALIDIGVLDFSAERPSGHSGGSASMSETLGGDEPYRKT